MKEARASEWFDVSVTVDGKKYAGRFQVAGSSRLLLVEVRCKRAANRTQLGEMDALVLARQLLSELVRGGEAGGDETLTHNIGSHGWPPFSRMAGKWPTAQINATPLGGIYPATPIKCQRIGVISSK